VRPVSTILIAITLLCLSPGRAPAQEEEPAPDLPAPRIVGPRLPEERKAVLSRNGGNAKTEAAVEAGLDWLARHRNPDGGWDADAFPARCEAAGGKCEGIGKGQHGEPMPCPFDHAISALATLAFLGHGHLPGAEGDPYGELVEEALIRLEDPRDPWALSLSTQAFAEAEALERKGRWGPMARADGMKLLSLRQRDGAWGYYPGGRGSDVPYTALAVQALLAARDAGLDLPEDFAARVDGFLGKLEERKGRLAYIARGVRFGYTPTSSNAHCAAAVRELLDVSTRGARHRAHMALVSKQKPVWKISFRQVDVKGRGKVPVQIGHLSMYQWWYGAIATFHKGGSAWSSWFGAAKKALLRHQRKKGCARGSWDPLGTYERQTGGRVFATALGVLILEQPYRHRRAD